MNALDEMERLHRVDCHLLAIAYNICCEDMHSTGIRKQKKCLLRSTFYPYQLANGFSACYCYCSLRSFRERFNRRKRKVNTIKITDNFTLNLSRLKVFLSKIKIYQRNFVLVSYIYFFYFVLKNDWLYLIELCLLSKIFIVYERYIYAIVLCWLSSRYFKGNKGKAHPWFSEEDDFV